MKIEIINQISEGAIKRGGLGVTYQKRRQVETTMEEILAKHEGLPIGLEVTIENLEEDELVFQELFANKDKYISKILSYDSRKVEFSEEISEVEKDDVEGAIISFTNNQYVCLPAEREDYPYKFTLKEKK